MNQALIQSIEPFNAHENRVLMLDCEDRQPPQKDMKPTSPTHVTLVAGEASGDIHAAHLLKELKKIIPNLTADAMGSDALKAQGAEILIDNRSVAVMGLVEIIKHYPKLRRTLKQMEAHIESNPPDLLILVDYVEFNLKLAKRAKELGIKVLFYVSPQVWAWRPGRVEKIGRVIDMMATIFPFEVKYYEEKNVPARYVGHPLVGKVKASASRDQLLNEFQLDDQHPIVGLQPGSRRSEISKLLEPFLEAAKILRAKLPEVQFVLPIAPGLERHELEETLKPYDFNVTLIPAGRSYDAMAMSDAILSASGTATLETTMMGTPLVIAHKVAPISYQIFKRLIRIPHIGLANIVAQREIIKEFIQDEAQPMKLADELERLITDSGYRSQMKRDMAEVTKKLGEEEGSVLVAELAAEMLLTN